MSLAKFLIKRTLQGIFVIWGVVTITFGLRAVAPGDPVDLVVDPATSPEIREQVRQDMGLDEPIYVQYIDYLQGILVGDLGFSYQSRRDVTVMVLERVPATLELAIAATIVAVVIAIPLGVISATRRHEPSDYGATMFSLVGISTPNFWLGIMLILVMSVQFGLFPVSERPVGFVEAVTALVTTGYFNDLITWFRHMTLPALTLGTYFTALITRLTRSGMVDELGKPYVTATEAKGLPSVLIRYKHVLRNTMIPIITVLGLQLGTLIGGAVITEWVFDWPGLGTRLINALYAGDWPVIQGVLIFIGIGFVVINIVVDSLYAYLNPRVVDE
ncbi:ABC-type transport system permease protein (probable substrate dipeptide/oligopeptide) [Natrialba magadii ATCC 43099]|uniref:ABC-type transport system permease protein (Probable substrate dipeptide/oligopeptide) n=1 Tax=Natrialba magadii (strain ATCC 43099 / DSM 3394 / CCM 3739 / CIP 104546 / IAM 13178 / JCM 8861 / NBRC 102185 / NCIMB 2190 / MS3) TaxID=547559 RepID=D3SWI3_NATMM|nr:ABC transporter permease [Natrialba magadii]ADD03775.1 ABC-type transport system permease protein (probable substrate dipeptide/oligopeptide) [Natrialba magadii ATCC 43099]ELY33830.1 binding-protein-dependent transport system inner membrane protein [Natrialba magadii ATCC 43099]